METVQSHLLLWSVKPKAFSYPSLSLASLLPFTSSLWKWLTWLSRCSSLGPQGHPVASATSKNHTSNGERGELRKTRSARVYLDKSYSWWIKSVSPSVTPQPFAMVQLVLHRSTVSHWVLVTKPRCFSPVWVAAQVLSYPFLLAPLPDPSYSSGCLAAGEEQAVWSLQGCQGDAREILAQPLAFAPQLRAPSPWWTAAPTRWPSPEETQQLRNEGINISAGTYICVRFQLALSGRMVCSLRFRVVACGLWGRV